GGGDARGGAECEAGKAHAEGAGGLRAAGARRGRGIVCRRQGCAHGGDSSKPGGTPVDVRIAPAHIILICHLSTASAMETHDRSICPTCRRSHSSSTSSTRGVWVRALDGCR